MGRLFKDEKKTNEKYEVRSAYAPKNRKKKPVNYKNLTREQSIWIEQNLKDKLRNLKNI